ncbi:hypothetical protein ACIG5E_33065 [Kitasatospora sp. NPDC053057]|uniref:hypothetical protein n=1 Tax=Kitasatospora sp. NPDC053057 TaxID=3364062 RepID=UPI0037CA1E36
MTWLTDQAVVLATTGFYALMLCWSIAQVRDHDGLFRFGVRPWIVFVLLVVLCWHLAVRRPKAAAVGSVAAVAAAFVGNLQVYPGETVGDAAQWAGQFALWFAVAWVFGGVSQTP